MSRAERLARIKREIAALRSGVLRLEGEAYGVKQKLDAIEAEFAELSKEAGEP